MQVCANQIFRRARVVERIRRLLLYVGLCHEVLTARWTVPYNSRTAARAGFFVAAQLSTRWAVIARLRPPAPGAVCGRCCSNPGRFDIVRIHRCNRLLVSQRRTLRVPLIKTPAVCSEIPMAYWKGWRTVPRVSRQAIHLANSSRVYTEKLNQPAAATHTAVLVDSGTAVQISEACRGSK